MYRHTQLGATPFGRLRKLHQLISNGGVGLGGYARNMIYGTLQCPAGKRMKPENRVFFKNEQEATQSGYRPCGICMPGKYRAWKAAQVVILKTQHE